MNWNSILKGFKAYLQLERSLSENSVDAYLRDMAKLEQYCELQGVLVQPEKLTQQQLEQFLIYVSEYGLSARTQARILSGLKAFYKYLSIEDVIEDNPTELLEAPKIGRKLPDVLSVEEINKLINAIDLSKAEGERNKAMLEPCIAVV
jgi:integrase/recombinase XerD